MTKKPALFALIFLFSTAISQEAVKFQIPTDSSGAPIPVVLPQKPDTVQKLGPAGNRPLNLVELSAKDTAGFETYSRRLALVSDSMAATRRAIGAVKNNTESFMPKLEPKGEFEKQSEYDARKAEWDRELADRTERGTKSYSTRLAELEKAKKKIEENQLSLYSSINIKSNPASASIWLGREEIGSTPADYGLLIPGNVKITIRKEGYNTWDTTFQAAPGAKYSVNAALEEKSIFSSENEIDFGKVLSRNSNIEGYEARIKTIEARKAEVGEELKKILENFADQYPALEPQKPSETPEAFKKRHDIWTREGMRQVAELQKKHKVYVDKLNRSIEVLNDYIIATHSMIINEPSLNAKIELGAYDAEREQFELAAQDTANEKTPFLFKGKVGVPRDTAKSLNRAAPGFQAYLHFVNYPFRTDSVNAVNLATSKLLLSKSGLSLKVDGSFGEIERYKSLDGYRAWKLHADSLVSGSLKPKGLDYSYAMTGKIAANITVADTAGSKGKSSGGGLGWRGWTRIVTYTLAAGCIGGAVVKHMAVEKNKDKVSDIDDILRNATNDKEYYRLEEEHRPDRKHYRGKVKDNEEQRLMFGIGAGVLALGGTVTFFF